jgi:hypothetical protein
LGSRDRIVDMLRLHFPQRLLVVSYIQDNGHCQVCWLTVLLCRLSGLVYNAYELVSLAVVDDNVDVMLFTPATFTVEYESFDISLPHLCYLEKLQRFDKLYKGTVIHLPAASG